MQEFDRQPVLAAASVVLRPLVAADRDALYGVASDPLLWAQHPAPDRWHEPVFARFFADALASGGALVAIDPGDGAIIGSSRYDFERAGPGEVEIGWSFVARRHWGAGINAEMKRLMLGHALRFVPRAIFLVGETNIRSRRAMENIGARLTERRHAVALADRTIDHVIYAIDRNDFAKGPLAHPI